MAVLPEPPLDPSPRRGRCLALYPQLSQRARRRIAAMLVVAALVAHPLAGYARADRPTGALGGNFRASIAQHAPASPEASGAGNPYASPAVARALRELGLDAPAAPAALDATPSGSQFQVNTYTTNPQINPSMAMDADGDFVVVWESSGSSGTDTSGYSVQAQRYDAAGSPQGSQFQVNTYTTSQQGHPSVAMDADGDFVVVWQSSGSGGTDTSVGSVQGQRYTAAGAAVGSEFQVNTYTTDHQVAPSVAMDADGDFMVAWLSLGSGGTDTDFHSIQGQRYDAAGSPQGGEFQVNTYTTGAQVYPSVAMDADGDFVVAWQSSASAGTDTGSYSIQAQRFDAAGTAVGSDFQVNTYTTSEQSRSSVAMDADGDFVVVWQSSGSGGTDTSGNSVQAQRYNAAGSPQGGQLQVNTYTTDFQSFPAVAMDADGDFVVAWWSYGSPATDTDGSIQAQLFDAAGTPEAGQLQVNTYTTDFQSFPAVAMDADGDFVVAWHSQGSGGTDTSHFSVQAQRYSPAGTAVTSQLQVNTYTTGHQMNPSVAMDADGDFVVVWQSVGSGGTDTDPTSIQAQLFSAGGSPQGGEFQVNTFTTSEQSRPSVAMDADGDFVVVWQSYGSGGTDASAHSIQGQRYSAAGAAVGGEFQVNTYTTLYQAAPSVAMDADGAFVVAWWSYGSADTDTDQGSIQAQRYNAAGAAVGGEFQVNTYTTGDQRYPSVAMDADGDFVVVWGSFGSGGTDTDNGSIQAQRHNAAGAAVGGEFQVNAYTTGDQRSASVAMDADGDFVVVWQSLGSGGTDTSGSSVQGQRHDATGSPQGSQFQVNTYTTSDQLYPSVALDADGNFVVVWQSQGSVGTDTSDFSVQAQHFVAVGTAAGSEFQVNTYTTNRQKHPAVAMDADGEFAVAWESFGSGGSDMSGYSVQAQRFEVPRGTIRIVKHTSPPNSPGDFAFRNDIDDQIFLLGHGEQGVFADIPPGTYKVSEIDPSPDYLVLGIDCDDDNSATSLLTATVNLEAGETVTCRFTNSLKIQIPTGARISRFAVDTDPTGRVVLAWETADERDVVGFLVYRARDPEGPFSRVGRGLLPSTGSSIGGARYRVTDVPGRGVFYYQLEVVADREPAERFGPLPARVDALRAFLALLVRR